ncbi:MAG: hypothetical protein ACMUHX_01190, partial [bacterium]
PIVPEGERIEDIESLIHHISQNSAINTVAFSPDGKNIASGSSDNTVRLWDTSSGKEVKRFKGHSDSVSSVAFSPDGKNIASGSRDNTVRLWDTSSGKEVKRFEGHSASVYSVAFSPDGKNIASGSWDNTVRLWDTLSGTQKGIFTGGQGGTWFTCLFNGSSSGPFSEHGASPEPPPEKKCKCLRYDDGTLLVKKGEDGGISPVLPPKPEEESNLEVVSIPGDLETYDGSATDFTIILKNSGKGPLYWVNVTHDVKGEKPVFSPSGTKVFQYPNEAEKPVFSPNGTRIIQDPNQGKSPVFHPPETKTVLAPGEMVDLACRVSVLSEYENPRGRDTLLSLMITSAFTEPVSVQIPVKVHTPRLELIEAKVQEEDILAYLKKKVIRPLLKLINKETQKEEPSTLLVSLKNAGNQDLLSETEFQASIANQPLDRVTREQIKRDETITLSFVIPQKLQTDPNTPPVALKVDKDTPLQLYAAKTEHPVHVWSFSGQRIILPSPPWFMYLLFLFLFAGSLIGVYYLRLYRHPLVVRLSASPESLSRLPIEQLSQALRMLQRTHRLDTVLSSNDIATCQLDEAIRFYENPDSGTRCEMLVKHLGAEMQKDAFWQEKDGGQPLPQVYSVRMGNDFMLNMDQCLLVFPPEGMSASQVLMTLKQKEDAQYQVCIIISTEKQQQADLHKMSQNPANMLVTPDSQGLTGLLLSPSPAEALAGLIATQVKVTRISPYQTRGGVNKENVFFGRFQSLAHIMQREPSNYLVVGGRQLGKSSLLKAVERRYRDDPNVACYYIVLNSEEIRGHLASALDFPPDTDLPVLLKEMGQIKKRKRYLFLIDEVDKFIEAEAKTGYKTLHLFRGLSEEGHCHFILAGFWGLYHAATFDYHSPVKNFAETLLISALEEEACFELATKPMHLLNIRYESEGLVKAIIQKTGGRANLIAITCNEILQQLDMQKRVISKKDMERAVNSHAIRSALSGWEVLSSEDKANRLDRIIVYATIKKESFTLADLLRILDEHRCAYEAEHVKQSLARLELAFILSRANQHYTFCVPIFKNMVLEQEPELLLEKECSVL